MDIGVFKKTFTDECKLFADLQISDVGSEVLSNVYHKRIQGESEEAFEKWKLSVADDQMLIKLGLEDELKRKIELSSTEDEKMKELKRKYLDAKDLMSRAKSELSKILRKKKMLETKCQDLRLDTESSPHDSEIIDNLKKKYTVCKSLTGIHWDYTSSDNLVKGYIGNKSTRYIQPFDFTGKETSTKLWKVIEEASHSDWRTVNDATDKENAIPN